LQKLQAQFAQDVYALRTVEFWIGEVCLGHQELHDENRMGITPLDDFDAKIRAILNKSFFESARSIAETVRIGLAKVLWS
jgi:hypothetical protein